MDRDDNDKFGLERVNAAHIKIFLLLVKLFFIRHENSSFLFYVPENADFFSATKTQNQSNFIF